MDRKAVTLEIDRKTDRVWGMLCELRPRLVRFDPPKVILNNRVWRTAGMCHQEARIVELGSKFIAWSGAYHASMMAVILPHEIIHQADFDLYGESEKSCGHGKNWRKLMLEYGLPDNPFHSMEITR